MIQSVQRAVQILQILSDHPNAPLPLGKIAELSGLNKSTCAHILETLCDSNMAERISRTDGYQVGVHAYYITRNGRYYGEVVELCAPLMRWLKEKTGHSIVLTMLTHHCKVILHSVDGINHLPNAYRTISYDSLYRFSSSHAILARMTPLQRAEFYEGNGYPTEYEWPELYAGEEAAYEQINRRGYEVFRCSYDHPNAIPGEIVVGMSKAFQYGDRMVFAIGVALPNEYGRNHFDEQGNPWHLTQEEEAHIARHLIAAVREIERRISFK